MRTGRYRRPFLNYDQRRRWIIKWLARVPEQLETSRCDALNQEFVDAYCEATGASVKMMPYGANKCMQLGRDLTRMHLEGSLERQRAGIRGMAGQGFPKWVWSYRLSSVWIATLKPKSDPQL